MFMLMVISYAMFQKNNNNEYVTPVLSSKNQGLSFEACECDHMPQHAYNYPEVCD